MHLFAGLNDSADDWQIQRREQVPGRITREDVFSNLLAGKIDETTKLHDNDFRNTIPRLSPENRKANLALVDLLNKIAEQKNATPAQIALAWLLAQKSSIVPIPGTTKLHRMEENVAAASVELTPHDLREIEDSAAQIKVQGARYSEQAEQQTNR